MFADNKAPQEEEEEEEKICLAGYRKILITILHYFLITKVYVYQSKANLV